MALQFVKQHHLRGLQNGTTTLTFLSLLRNLKLPGTVRWVSGEIPVKSSFRSYATAKSERIIPIKKKKRLDEVCLERYQQYSRSIIQSWILQGKVYVNGKVINKAGTPVSDKSVVEIIAEVPKYVCRAGHKLEGAIEQLGIDVAGKVALDSGLSTGGFTDCLLQYGASHVYGVDVGYGQVAEKIRRDERVSIIERTNLRYLKELPQNVDLVTLDLSFISILTVMPAVVNVMKEDAALVTLVKPQFEARRSQVGKGGIVKDPLVHQEVLEKITKGVESFGFCSKGWIESPLKGAEGNTEFLVHFSRIRNKDSKNHEETKESKLDDAFLQSSENHEEIKESELEDSKNHEETKESKLDDAFLQSSENHEEIKESKLDDAFIQSSEK